MAKKLHYADSPTAKDQKAMSSFLSEDEDLILVTGYGSTYLKSKAVVFIMWPGMFIIAACMGYAWYSGLNLGYGLLVGLVLAIVSAILLTIRMHHANRYLLTTRRVIVKKGIVAVKLISALYDKITHIEVDQTFADKVLMHHGVVIINTAGANNDQIILHNVEYPIEFKNLLERLINRERQQFNRSTPLVEVQGEIIS